MSTHRGAGISDTRRGDIHIEQVTGECWVCCHRVTYRWWKGTAWKCPDELKARLEEAAEERAKACIVDGCGSGQLFYEDATISLIGWWEINYGDD